MKDMHKQGAVAAVCKKAQPGLPKFEVEEIHIVEGHGVDGDYHAGKFIRHRWLAELDPTQPNNRQVLLVDNFIYEDIFHHGIDLEPGMLGENILVDGINLMKLPIGTTLSINDVILEITEIRRPCYQLNEMHPDLESVVMPDKEDEKTWNAGMLAIVLRRGSVRAGDEVRARDFKNSE